MVSGFPLSLADARAGAGMTNWKASARHALYDLLCVLHACHSRLDPASRLREAPIA